MGDAFIVRRGGGGKLFAAISVTYPQGSVCTCVKGTKTLTAKGTGGSYIFYVPEAGTWTVSCTDGTRTKSQDVVISTEYEAESVVIAYELYVYNRGVEGVPLSTYHRGGGSVSKGSSYITLTTSAVLYEETENNVYTENVVDITPYSKVSVKAKSSGANTHHAYLKIGSVVSVEITNSSSEQTFEIDTSEIRGSYTVGVYASGYHPSGGGSSSRTTYVYEILLS